KDHAEASRRYQEALEAIDDKLMTKRAPNEKVIRTIFKKAEDARLLSASYVPVPKTRGVPQGLGAPTIRGIKIKKIAVPITFEFGTTTFTAKGEAAASDLLSYLKAQGSPKITLVGHTDPVGPASYNLGLSEERAFAVKDYLAGSGYGGGIHIVGKGEHEPYQPADISRYSEEELHQMSRRVELLR
ncbi:MAG: OmpA family protein, partial [Pseudomonadota bacterium]